VSGERVLLVDDDSLFRDAAADWLERDGLVVYTAGDLATAQQLLAEGISLVVVDQRLPDGNGLSLVQRLRDQGHRARVLVVTGHPEVGDAVEALRLRIDDYLTKPLKLEVLRLSVLRSLETLRLERTDRLAQREHDHERGQRLIGNGLAAARQLIAVAAASTSPVLITGETGTGKSLAATAIHYRGDAQRPFVKVNCAAIPETLVEAELFGVEKGAFTGATASREGLFELADGGTLLLDEIGELDLGVQAKLLGVLEDGAARRVGGTRPRRFRVRIIAATNVDVGQAVESGRFRRDLFYRLNVVRIDLPPLRDRLDDLPELIPALLAKLPNGRGAVLAAGDEALLRRYRWPGNVRELCNLLERALLIDPPQSLAPSRLLPDAMHGEPSSATPVRHQPLASLQQVEEEHIQRVVASCGGNRTQAARVLGIGLATLRRRLNRSG
jgi:DNA-binding NtrC family response regulator